MRRPTIVSSHTMLSSLPFLFPPIAPAALPPPPPPSPPARLPPVERMPAARLWSISRPSASRARSSNRRYSCAAARTVLYGPLVFSRPSTYTASSYPLALVGVRKAAEGRTPRYPVAVSEERYRSNGRAGMDEDGADEGSATGASGSAMTACAGGASAAASCPSTSMAAALEPSAAASAAASALAVPATAAVPTAGTASKLGSAFVPTTASGGGSVARKLTASVPSSVSPSAASTTR